MPSDYRLSPPVAARLLGAGLLVMAVLVFLATGTVAALHLPVAAIGVLAAVVLVAVVVGGSWLTKGYVVRFDDDGYHVRLIRGAGVTRGRWAEVEDAVTTELSGARCVVLRLADGRRTTIPVDVLAGDREAFVRDVQAHLQHGHGLRQL